MTPQAGKKTPPNPPKKPTKLPTSPPQTNKDTQRTPSIFHPLFENSIFYLYINIKSRSLCSKILKNKIKHFTVYPVWFLSWNNLKKSLAPMFIHIIIRITFASSFLNNLTWFHIIFTQNLNLLVYPNFTETCLIAIQTNLNCLIYIVWNVP